MTLIKDNKYSIIIIIRERLPARDILIIPHIILIEQFINKHVIRKKELFEEDDGTYIINKNDEFEIPDDTLINESINCIENSLNRLPFLNPNKEGIFYAEIDHIRFNNLAAKEYILDISISDEPIINPNNNKIFEFGLQLRVVKKDSYNAVLNDLTDRTFTDIHKAAIEKEYNIISYRINDRNNKINELKNKKIAMGLEITKLEKMRDSITIELNKLNYSGHGITELRQEYLGINNLTNEEINKIENEKN